MKPYGTKIRLQGCGSSTVKTRKSYRIERRLEKKKERSKVRTLVKSYLKQ